MPGKPAAPMTATRPARKKSELPQKPCAVCGLPMVWRKRWRNNWDRVLYCSERCRRSAPRRAAEEPKA